MFTFQVLLLSFALFFLPFNPVNFGVDKSVGNVMPTDSSSPAFCKYIIFLFQYVWPRLLVFFIFIEKQCFFFFSISSVYRPNFLRNTYSIHSTQNLSSDEKLDKTFFYDLHFVFNVLKILISFSPFPYITRHWRSHRIRVPWQRIQYNEFTDS